MQKPRASQNQDVPFCPANGSLSPLTEKPHRPERTSTRIQNQRHVRKTPAARRFSSGSLVQASPLAHLAECAQTLCLDPHQNYHISLQTIWNQMADDIPRFKGSLRVQVPVTTGKVAHLRPRTNLCGVLVVKGPAAGTSKSQ